MFVANAETLDSKKLRKVFVLDDEDTFSLNNGNLVNIGNETAINERYSTETEYDGHALKKRNSKNDIPKNMKSTLLKQKQNSYESPSTIKDLSSSFFKKSSIYALNQIGNSSTTRRKVFWSFILIGGLIGCCSQVYRYLKVYYEYPVVISIDAMNLFNLEFPGVTICNLNNVKRTYFHCILDKLDVEECNSTNSLDSSNADWKSSAKWNHSFCLDELGEPLNKEFLERIHFLSLYLSLNESSKIQYGHQGEDFIKYCAFNGEECSHTDFIIFVDDAFGNCFSFNNANRSKAPFQTSFVGPNSGLHLELDVQNNEYVWLSQSVGARVVVHDPYQNPTPHDQGINVSPGFETSIGLSKIMFRRLEYPYKDKCKVYERGDSKKLCDSVCHQKMVSEFCGCSKGQFEKHCDITNITELCCVYRGRKDEENITCDCPLECVLSNYELKISSGVWPADPRNIGNENLRTLAEIRETRVKVKIYYETLEQIVYQQKAMFEDSEVLSQIGGQMGLWLGLSLAAMFECLENIVLFCHYRSRKGN